MCQHKKIYYNKLVESPPWGSSLMSQSTFKKITGANTFNKYWGYLKMSHQVVLLQNFGSPNWKDWWSISNLDCEEPEKVISILMTNFGRVSSEADKILFWWWWTWDVNWCGLTNLQGRWSIEQKAQIFWQKSICPSEEWKRQVFKCFWAGHIVNVGKKEKNWS